jgi:hypothetical protein
MIVAYNCNFCYYYHHCCCVAQISDEEDNDVKEGGIKVELIAKIQKLTILVQGAPKL